MSSVLRRLIRRASGESSTGLRPRRPARFESGFDSALHEVHIEHAARPTPIAFADDLGAAGQGILASFRGGDEPHSMLRAEARGSRAGSGASHRDAAEALHGDRSAEAPLESGPLEIQPGLLPPASSGQPSLETSTTAVSTEKRRRVAPESRPAERVPPAVPDVRTAPEPLLPAAASGMAEPAEHALAAPPSAARAAGQTSSDDSAPSEITIHIGRLDIRAEPPRPAPRSRAAKAATLPPLSEYLRGGRS